jgi:hypothetical protein
MANFNWDDFQDEDTEQQGFDWNSLEDAPEEPTFLSKLGQKAEDAFQSGNELAASIVQPTLETAQDFSTGVAKGVTMGSADELGGLIGAGTETLLGKLGIGPSAVDEQLRAQGFDLPEESFGDKYRQYQQGSEKAFEEAAERSPVAETLGQIGGGITSGVAMGGLLGVGKAAQGAKSLSEIAKNEGMLKALGELGLRGGKSYLKAAPAIAAESALSSKEHLIGDEARPEALAADVAGGLAFGLPAVIGLEGVSQAVVPSVSGKIGAVKQKIADAFADEGNPRLRQMAKAYQEYGKDLGIHPRSHGADIAGQKFALRDQKAASQVLNVVDSADAKLGKGVSESIEQATQRGAMVDVGPDIQAAANRIMQLSQELPDLGATRKSAMAMDKILNGQQQLTPSEVKNLIDDLDAAIGTFKAATNKDAAAVGTLNELLKYRKAVSQTFKDTIPEYRQAAERFESFREVLEQLISGDRPADVTQTFYGNLRNQDQKVYDRLIDMVQNVQRPAQSSQSSRTAFTNFMDSLENFQSQELARGSQQVLPSAESVRKYLLNASDDSVLRGSVRATTESRSVVPDLKEAIIGKAPTSGAYLAGKAVKKVEEIAAKPLVTKTAAMTKAIYKAPAQAVSNLASKLETSGQFQNLGKALREAVENGDTAKKNAALFTIMQNPNARAFISAEDFPDVDQEE